MAIGRVCQRCAPACSGAEAHLPSSPCAGLKPAPRKAVRRREKADRKKKARKQAKLRSVTNVHLMHLLDGDAPVTID